MVVYCLFGEGGGAVSGGWVCGGFAMLFSVPDKIGEEEELFHMTNTILTLQYG